MTTVELTVVSDSHLSPSSSEANSNWQRVLDHIAAAKPAAVVHTGDISLDGAASDTDLEHAKRLLQASTTPIMALPGNHDLGDNPCETNDGSDRLVTTERLARYRHVFGADRWRTDIGGWRLLGLNAQLLGSGLEEEAEQWEWLEAEADDAGRSDRHVACFTHKPLLHSEPHPVEHDVAIRYIRPDARARLFTLLGHARARLVVSGHVHQHHRLEARGMHHLWAPTSWATISSTMQSTVGERWVGALQLSLHEDGSHVVEPVRLDDDCQHIIGETVPNPYNH